MPTPPTFTKVNPADQPILYLALTSPTLPLWTLDEYAETRIAQRISMVTGVAQVQVLGAQKYAVHVQMDPHALAAAPDRHQRESKRRCKNWNVNLPTGAIIGPQRAFTLQASGQLMNADQYRPLVVAYRNGAPVRLEELGDVIDSVEDDKTASWFYTQQRPAARHHARHPAPARHQHHRRDRRRQEPAAGVPAGAAALGPHGHPVRPVRDHPRVLPGRAVHHAADAGPGGHGDLPVPAQRLGDGHPQPGAAVLDHRHVRGDVPAELQPGQPVDDGADPVVGFVVDDAIVMLENIVRHMEMGEQPLAAALIGSREIGFTIVSMTLSLAAVFIPVLFMGGILGRLFREFSVTICVAILISGVVSVTLTPMLCSRFLRAAHEASTAWFYRITERFFEGMLRVYDRTLQLVLRLRPAIMATFVLVLVATVLPVRQDPQRLHSRPGHRPVARSSPRRRRALRTIRWCEYQSEVAEIVAQGPQRRGARCPPSAARLPRTWAGPTSANWWCTSSRAPSGRLVERHHRGTAAEAGRSFRACRSYLQNPPTIRIGGQVTKSLYQYSMQSPDKAELYATAQKLERLIEHRAGVEDVTSDVAVTSPQVNVNIDRDKAAAMQRQCQPDRERVLRRVRSALGVDDLRSVNEYKVLLELSPKYQADPRALSLLYFKTPNGKLIPLDTLAHVMQEIGPQTINHFGQLPAATSRSTSLRARRSATWSSRCRTWPRSVAGTISTHFQGAAKAFQSSLANLWVLLLVAIMVVYIVLGILYESYIHPLTILSGLPSAGFGALVTLCLFHMDLNIYAFVGLIMLIGIVEKNAIMQIDFALEAERNAGLTPEKAIYQGCLIRFRPIMMTTMAALLGAVPIALGYGAGGEARQPLGLVVVGGLMFSQLVTLYLTPVFYTYMSALQKWVKGWKHEKVPVAVA